MHVPFWLAFLVVAWFVLALAAVGVIAWVARWGPTEEEALAMTRPAPAPAPEPAAPPPGAVPVGSDAR